MRSRRAIAAIAAGILVAVTLTGCETVGSLVDEARIGSALSELKTEVEAIDGMGLEYPEPELQGDYSYRVNLTMAASADVSDAGIQTALSAVHETLSNSVFETNPASFGLDAVDRGQFTTDYYGVSEQEFENESSYWLAVQQATGTRVDLSLGQTDTGPYRAVTFVQELDAADVRAVAAVPAPVSKSASWTMPGLEAYGTLPDGAELALFTKLGAIFPRLDYWSGGSARGVLVYLNGDGRVGVLITLVGEEPSTIAESEEWPLVLKALDATIASGVPATFGVQPDESLGSVTVRWGECEHPYETPEIDAALFALLQEHGLPVDAVPGGC